MPANIPFRIKQRRKELSLSQSALAQACGVGQSTVANWERGGHTPRQATLHKIATALQTDETWLLSGERVNATGPINNYLSCPIRHVPIFNWPRHPDDLRTTTPQSYIPLATTQDNVFGLTLAQDMEPFKAGTILTFTRDYDETEQGIFLDVLESESSLSDTHSTRSKAKLIYSLTPH